MSGSVLYAIVMLIIVIVMALAAFLLLLRKKCSSCGGRNPLDQSVCIQCGTKFPDE